MLGRILSSSTPISSAIFANSLAAAMHISSLIIFALTSSVPLKIPGNPRELLTWLGKSDLPVATILAPASFASQGQTSGIGLAQAKIPSHPPFLRSILSEQLQDPVLTLQSRRLLPSALPRNLPCALP